MIPKGTYRAVPVDACLGRTSTGKEQIALMFEIAMAGDEPPYRIAWYGYFTDATFDRTIDSLRHIGWTGSDLSDFVNGLPEGASQEVEIVVDHEQDQAGEWKARVRWVNSGRGIAVKERLDEASARSFGAAMKGRIAALQAGRGRASAGTGAPAGNGGNGHSQAAAASRRPLPGRQVEDAQDFAPDDAIPF